MRTGRRYCQGKRPQGARTASLAHPPTKNPCGFLRRGAVCVVLCARSRKLSFAPPRSVNPLANAPSYCKGKQALTRPCKRSAFCAPFGRSPAQLFSACSRSVRAGAGNACGVCLSGLSPRPHFIGHAFRRGYCAPCGLCSTTPRPPIKAGAPDTVIFLLDFSRTPCYYD